MANDSTQNSKFSSNLPPQDQEAEKSLLGSLMLDKKAINKVAAALIPPESEKMSIKRPSKKLNMSMEASSFLIG